MVRCLFFLVFFIIVSVFSPARGAEEDNRDEMYRNLDLFGEALVIIQKKYVEAEDPKELIYGAIEGLLLRLDPYSQFLEPDDYKELVAETEGQFGGLGIEITLREGLLTIVSPLEDTPAWRAGIKPGDIIVKIDGELTKNITLNEAVKKMRGDPGTDVVLTILREDEGAIKEFTITRDIIKIKDIRHSLLFEDNIGYIRLSEFRESTDKDLDKALAGLQEQGMKGLILDLRNNPGGLLDSAAKVASRFLNDNLLIVYTESRTGREFQFRSLRLSPKYLDIPMVVLINTGSASGSEIVAAALRDHQRAILLGEKSFGKGSVQTVIPLSDGSAIRLTTSKYYTPRGISIHDKGIDPDIIVSGRDLGGGPDDVFDNIDKEEGGFEYKKDYQIVRALDLIKGLLVLSSQKE